MSLLQEVCCFFLDGILSRAMYTGNCCTSCWSLTISSSLSSQSPMGLSPWCLRTKLFCHLMHLFFSSHAFISCPASLYPSSYRFSPFSLSRLGRQRHWDHFTSKVNRLLQIPRGMVSLGTSHQVLVERFS